MRLSSQRSNRAKGYAALCITPRFDQFRLVQFTPLPDQSQGAPRKAALEHAPRPDCDLRFMRTLDRMKVRGRVISVVHVDRDPVEVGDPRHAFLAMLFG